MNSFSNIVLATAYLPPIEYFSLIKRCPQWRLEHFENYTKQSYRNRCHIYGANSLLSLTIPISRRDGSSVPITQTKIEYNYNWQLNHWRAILSAYNQTPFFLFYEAEFRPFYTKRYKYLIELNSALTSLILELLALPTTITPTQEYCKSVEGIDFRQSIHPKRPPIYDNTKKGQYHQVFAQKYGFISNLSIIDLLFNEGPNSIEYL